MSPLGFTVMSIIILFMAVWFSPRNAVSSELPCQSAAYWIGMVWRIRCADVGPWAITSEITAIDAVVANEITRLRTKERENKVMLPPNIGSRCARGLFHCPAWSFPGIFLEVCPKNRIPFTQPKPAGPATMTAEHRVLN